jgi:hypothetical protein
MSRLGSMVASSFGPRDEERDYRSLRAEYGFNPDALRQQFLDTAADMVLELQCNAKQQNLLRFRPLVPPDLTMGEPLFLCDFGQVSTRDNYQLSQVLLWPSTPATYSLSTEIRKVYDTPWIVQYFIISTFPAFFGHFFTAEYLAAGFNFIQSHINDDIAAELVGSFLFHSVLFCDRLFQFFWGRLSACERSPDAAGLAQLLLASIRAAASYLSGWHMKAVALLRQAKGDKVALDAVFRDFLLEVVDQWRFSPRMSGTTVTLDPDEAPELSCVSFQTDSVVTRALTLLCTDPATVGELLGVFCDCQVDTEYPKAAQTVFYGGIKFNMSVVDSCLLDHFSGLVRFVAKGTPAPNPTGGNTQTAFGDAFRIRVRFVHSFAAAVREPVPTETSEFLTKKKLLEHKAVHDYLFGLSGGLRSWDVIIEAQRSLLALAYRRLANSYFTTDPVGCNPLWIARRQFGGYGLQVASHFLVDSLRRKMEPLVQGDFTAYLDAEITKRIGQSLGRATSVEQAILVTVVDFINEWKAKILPDAPRTMTSQHQDYTYCRLFAAGAMRLLLELCCLRLGTDDCSLAHVGIPMEGMVGEFVSDEGDLAMSSVVANEGDVGVTLRKADDYFQRMAEAHSDGADTGNHIVLFLEIEEMLRTVMMTPQVVESSFRKKDWKTKLVRTMLAEREGKFLREGLLKCLFTLRRLRSSENNLGRQLNEIRNPFGAEVIAAFRNLAEWFALKFEFNQ